jgi:hypothetical protein
MLSPATLLVALSTQLQAQDTIIRLPVRFHLLHAPAGAVTTTRTAASVDTLVAFANTVWHQASIEWVVEAVIHEEAPRASLLDSMIAGTLPVTRERLASFVPHDRLFRSGWNVFLLRDFGRIAGGAFIPELNGVLLAERGYGYELPSAGRGGGTLAHELGHSLGLSHQACDSTRNIMANACSQPGVVSSLTPAQVAVARRQALTGPAPTIPYP